MEAGLLRFPRGHREARTERAQRQAAMIEYHKCRVLNGAETPLEFGANFPVIQGSPRFGKIHDPSLHQTVVRHQIERDQVKLNFDMERAKQDAKMLTNLEQLKTLKTPKSLLDKLAQKVFP